MMHLLNIRVVDEGVTGIVHVMTASLAEATALAESILSDLEGDPDDIAIFEVDDNWECTLHGDQILCGVFARQPWVN